MNQCTVKNHQLSPAIFRLSDNHNDRPDNDLSKIELIVIHNISLPPEQFGGKYIQQFFTNKLNTTDHPYFKTLENIRVSAHLLIDRHGITTQFVPFNKRAWHAGTSKFQNRTNCNDFSIGIELEGTDNTPYTEHQYQTLIEIIKALKKTYPIQHITGHNQIAPNRKTDPGIAFDWSKITEIL